MSMPFSATLLLDPTDAYSLLPSGLAIRFLVQWWLMPAGRSAIFSPGESILVCPVSYGKRITASALATYRRLPMSAMPNGEFRPSSSTWRVSAMPS
ncbi:hypothetical protein D9M68_896810 [compost metagenome]